MEKLNLILSCLLLINVRCNVDFPYRLTVFLLYHMIIPEMTDFRPVSA